MEYTLAARIQGKPQEEIKLDEPAKKEAAKPAPAEVKAIVICDLDLIGEQFFAIRRQKVENLDFDNITFVLNCVDVLAGDDAYIALRKRRAQHRTLARLEQQTRDFVTRSQKEAKAGRGRGQGRARTGTKVARRQGRQGPATTRSSTTGPATSSSRPWSASRTGGSRSRRPPSRTTRGARVQESKATMEQSVRAIENRVRVGAILAAPLPALLLAAFIFGIRAGKENQGANPNRLA